MSYNDTPSPDHGQDDKLSWRWSTESVASTSVETSRHDESTYRSIAPAAHEITAEALSLIPGGYNMLEASTASLKDGDFHERHVRHPQEEEHLSKKRVSAITVSLQRCSDIISRDHTQVDPQAEMLVGLQMHMKADPPAGFPADLRADLGSKPRETPLAAPEIAIDDHADDDSFEDHIEGAYATAYQMRAAGTTRLESGVADTMRREAAMDDAIFRPNMRLTMLIERRGTGESVGSGTAVRRDVRKRKRELKDTD